MPDTINHIHNVIHLNTCRVLNEYVLPYTILLFIHFTIHLTHSTLHLNTST
jgi:hypothetical protein